MAGDLKGLGDLLSGGRVNLPTPRPPEIPKDKRKKNVRFATLPEDAHPIDHLYNNREGEFEEAEYFRELAKAKTRTLNYFTKPLQRPYLSVKLLYTSYKTEAAVWI